jgi:hypothetical protein
VLVVLGLAGAWGLLTVVSAWAADPPRPKACADQRDNDGDGLVDLADPGCGSAHDNSEQDGDAEPEASPTPTATPTATATATATAEPADTPTATPAQTPPVPPAATPTAPEAPAPAAAPAAPAPPPAGEVLGTVEASSQPELPPIVVRMAGVLRPRGALVRLLRVTAPRGATVLVRCRGRRCPVARLRAKVTFRSVRLRRLERLLIGGTRVQIRVLVPGHQGKYTAFRIRRHRAPARVDACLPAGRTRPGPC